MRGEKICMVQNILDEIILTYLKEKAPFYEGGAGMIKKQQNK